MRLHRFYISQPLGEEVVIEDVSLVSQLTKVFRYTQGDFIILFNGDGNDYCYSITDLTKKTVACTRTKTTPSYIPTQKITLCMSVIRKDTFELVVQKATELGVTTIVPIMTLRSEKKNLSFERLEKIIIEASEQCGRGDIPVITPITTLDSVLVQPADAHVRVMLHMGEESLLSKREELMQKAKNSSLVLFIGPEGGWDDDEIHLMKTHNVHSCSLGKTVLRAETAAIVAVSVFCI